MFFTSPSAFAKALFVCLIVGVCVGAFVMYYIASAPL
jgi:hypothetical protein